MPLDSLLLLLGESGNLVLAVIVVDPPRGKFLPAILNDVFKAAGSS